jgi:hypothetical protein
MQAALKIFQELKDRPRVRPAKVVCRNHALAAPRSKKDADKAISVEEAANTWCRDNDGRDINSEGIYWRWGITKLGVTNRESFWLRAAKTCDNPGKFNRWECKRALLDGMNKCDKGPETHGLAASVGCLDYSIDFSSTTDSAHPPWVDTPDKIKFPPPEDAVKEGSKDKFNAPICDPGKGERPLTDEDLNKSIDAFCQDGHDIKGFGKNWDNMFDYPPPKTPQFYHLEHNTMHLTFGAETINNGGKKPYQDMGWCKYVSTSRNTRTWHANMGRNYDWKLGKDDCTYALRKLYKSCTKDRAKSLNGGEFTYRCVRYKSWAVNIAQ